jgi:hypothetical protein
MPKAPSTSTNDEVVAGLAKLRRGSRLVLPFAVLAFGAIASMVWIAGRELRDSRARTELAASQLDERQADLVRTTREVEAARDELARTLAKKDEAQQLLNLAEQKIELIEGNAGPGIAPDLAAVLEDLAVADASLTNAGPQTGAGLSPSASIYGTFNVDVFYCENQGSKVQQDAERLVGLRGSAPGRWRVRVLRESVNRGSSYRLSGNEIRYNPTEERVAKLLQAEAQAELGLAFELVPTGYPTPSYVSAFVCAGRR